MKIPSFKLIICAMVISTQALCASHNLGNGVVAQTDTNHAQLFITDPQGQLASIDFAGKAIWQLRDQGIPLIAQDQRLLALGLKNGRRFLRWLDAENGRSVLEAEWMLPNDVDFSAEPRAGSSQQLNIRETTDNVFELQWQFKRETLRGAWLEESEVAQAATDSIEKSGAIVIRVSDSALTIETLSNRNVWIAQPVNLSNEERLSNLPGEQYRAQDDRSVLRSTSRADAQFGSIYQWQLFDREAGRLLGQITLPFAQAPFLVRDQIVVSRLMPYLSQDAMQSTSYAESLVAFDLVSGKELWRVPVQDSSYRGELPP
jgi:hypothetical protein